MAEDRRMTADEAELKAAIEAVLDSPSRKKLVIAGPGTGKTSLFRQMLELASGQPERRIVLTFINNLKDDLKRILLGWLRSSRSTRTAWAFFTRTRFSESPSRQGSAAAPELQA